MKVDFAKIKTLLDDKLEYYNHKGFVPLDPISIPHQYQNLQDIEISGFFAATLAWGQRPTIISKSKELLQRMDNAPYDFILNHKSVELKRLEKFVHRTFNDTDLLFFVEVLQDLYSKHHSMESLLLEVIQEQDDNIEKGLNHLHSFFFDRENYPERSKKHLAAPFKKSACKRLNMFLRWMVRDDEQGVDFGLWKKIRKDQLICPLDLHVERVAKKIGLLDDKNKGWKAAVELTKNLKQMDPADPVKYDIALFALGIDKVY